MKRISLLEGRSARCSLCGKSFVYQRKQRATRDTCSSCITRHRFALKAASIAYKGGGCQLCGYNRCHRALSFHHVDALAKLCNLRHNLALGKRKKELDKCICLCLNCHQEVEDALQWCPDASILTLVRQKHAEFVSHEFVFTRKDWTWCHPKYLEDEHNK